MLTIYPQLTISGPPWRSKPITFFGERRGRGNKGHRVHVWDGGDSGVMEQVVAGQHTGDAAGMKLAVGGVITAAVRFIAVVCKVGTVWRDDLDEL